MGYRANVITQHREYGSQPFGRYEIFEGWFNKLYELYPEASIYQSESQDYFEIEKDVIKKEIERLTKLGLDKEFEFQDSYDDYKDTNQTYVEALMDALAESPLESSYVSLEWF